MSSSDHTRSTQKQRQLQQRLFGSAAATITDLRSQSPERIAERYVGTIFDDNTVCNWCLDQRRIPYPEYDQARLNAKDMRKNSAAINSWSTDFERRDDGTLQVISATSGPSPTAYSEVIEGAPQPEFPGDDRWSIPRGFINNPRRRDPPRPKTICGDCARIDVDPTEDRSKRQVIRAVRNLLDHASSAGLPIDHDHAVGMCHALLTHDSVQGKDRWVFERSLAYGIEIQRKRQRQRRSNAANSRGDNS